MREGFRATSFGWIFAVFSMELRKVFSYRADFWLHMIGGFVSQFVVAYFLWQAIFEYNKVDQIGGYTFQLMIAYYIMAPFVDRIVRANNSFIISQEIYEGTLSRYLIYPVNYLGFRFVSTLAHATVGLVQMTLGVGLIFLIWGIPEGVNLDLSSLAMGLASCFMSIVVYYLMASTLEMVAFWADNVWSLLVMLQFTTAFVGGGLIPLSVFSIFDRLSDSMLFGQTHFCCLERRPVNLCALVFANDGSTKGGLGPR